MTLGMSWQTMLQLGRVSNLPTVWTNVLAGIVLAGGTLADTRTFALIVAMSLFYLGGMYLNDAFDAEIDAAERSERPIPSGRANRTTVFVAGFAMLAAGLLIVSWISTGVEPILAGLALAAAIVFYDWYHKANPLSPVVMGLCRALVYVTAGLCFTASLPATLWIAAGLLWCYLIGLTYVAKQENIGRVENMWPLAFLAAPVLYTATFIPQAIVTLPFWILFVGWVAFALWLVKRRAKGDIPRAVVSLIAGMSLLDAVFIAAAGQTGVALVAVAAFGLTLALQRYVSGT